LPGNGDRAGGRGNGGAACGEWRLNGAWWRVAGFGWRAVCLHGGNGIGVLWGILAITSP